MSSVRQGLGLRAPPKINELQTKSCILRAKAPATPKLPTRPLRLSFRPELSAHTATVANAGCVGEPRFTFPLLCEALSLSSALGVAWSRIRKLESTCRPSVLAL